jgi:hypothetical protein
MQAFPLEHRANQNRVTHCLCNHGRSVGGTASWVCHVLVLDSIAELVLADCNPISLGENTSFPRKNGNEVMKLRNSLYY